jgi:hypothetical protein
MPLGSAQRHRFYRRLLRRVVRRFDRVGAEYAALSQQVMQLLTLVALCVLIFGSADKDHTLGLLSKTNQNSRLVRRRRARAPFVGKRYWKYWLCGFRNSPDSFRRSYP